MPAARASVVVLVVVELGPGARSGTCSRRGKIPFDYPPSRLSHTIQSPHADDRPNRPPTSPLCLPRSPTNPHSLPIVCDADQQVEDAELETLIDGSGCPHL